MLLPSESTEQTGYTKALGFGHWIWDCFQTPPYASPTPSPDWTHFGFCFSVRVVPSTPKNAGHNSPAKSEDLPFEEALKRLEAIVEAMESEDLPLETLLAKYEEGTQLSRICQQKLAEAEVKIQQLEKNAAGEIKLKPLTLEETEPNEL